MTSKNSINYNSLNEQLLPFLTKASDGATPKRKIPPLERWQPTGESDIDIHIRDNGEWYHEGVKMTRQSLVDLFASVLWVEVVDGCVVHYLKTPTDKYRIRVDDVPLFINRVDVVRDDGVDWLEFGTTNGDVIRLDDAHLPYFSHFGDEERLYVKTRFGLVAKVMNNVMFHLISLGTLDERIENNHNKTVLKLASGGKIYEICQS